MAPRRHLMANILEMLGRGLTGSLASIFQDHLQSADRCSMSRLEERLDAAPGSAEDHLQLGLKYLQTGRLGQARTQLEAAVDADELGDAELAAQLGLACANEELGRYPEAIDHLQDAMRCGGEYPEVLAAAAGCAERADLSDQAIQLYERALQIDPLYRRAHERLAAISLHKQNRRQAADHYRQLTSLFPGDVGYHLTLANLLVIMDETEEAIAHYQHALLIDPENWEADQELAVAFEKAGLYLDAIEQLEAVCPEQDDDPAMAGICVRLGDLYGRLAQDRLSLAAYERALRLNPNLLEASVKLGTHHLRMGRYADAAQSFNRSVEINDEMLSAYVGLGIAQARAGEPEQARDTLDLAAGLEPNSSLLFSEMAKLQLRAAIDEAAERAPEPAEDHDAWAGGDDRRYDADAQSGAQGLLELQIERHRKAVAAHPERADLRYRYGLLLRHKGRYDEAIEQFQHAVNINPAYVKALVKLGLALHESGRRNEAVQCLQRALDIKPNYIDLHYRLGVIFADKKRFNLAVEHFEEALARTPDGTDFHPNLRLALRNMGLARSTDEAWPGDTRDEALVGANPGATSRHNVHTRHRAS